MTNQGINIVQAKALHEGQGLRVVGAQISRVALFKASSLGGAGAFKRVGVNHLVEHAVNHVAGNVQLQPRCEGNVGRKGTINLV